MDKQIIKNKLEEACSQLYAEVQDLITNQTHERTIASQLSQYLIPLFNGWDVHVEYNREGNERKSKQSVDGELLLPDIIIHKRGNKTGPNLVSIQMKGFWNTEDRSKDGADLRKLRKNYGYTALYRLELNPDDYELIEVS